MATLIVGWVVVLISFFVIRDLFGDAAAKFGSVLMVFNAAYLERSTHVDCETLLMIFFLSAWYFMIRGLSDNRYWIWAGVSSGLAYMTKGPEILLIPVFFLSGLFVFRFQILKNKYFWYFFLGFLALVSPLFIRNIVVYHALLYDDYNSNIFWINSLRELSDKYALTLNWHQHTFSTTKMPTLLSYIQTHSYSEIARRAINGLIGEAGLLLNSLNLFMIRSPLWSQFVSLLLAVLFTFGIVRDPDKRRVVYTLTGITIFFIPFSWFFKVYAGMRYLTPLLPLIVAYGAFGGSEFLKEIDRRVPSGYLRFRVSRVVPMALTLFLMPVAAYAAATKNVTPLIHSVDLPDDEHELMDWFRDNVKEDDVVIFRPTVHYWGALWHADFKGKVAMISRHDPLPEMDVSEFRGLLKKRKISLIVLHKEDYASPPILKEYFEYTDRDGLVEKKTMEGWHRVYESAKIPTPFVIYRIDQ
ncbi:MAG: glycosyltransferase family 39 protein [Nitrospirae bacterium]|nr:glycosyltransferase family 39 protein [Nitrospirota bacterium]